MPGMDATGSRTASSATTKSGCTRWRTDSSVSRTRSRSAEVARRRRMRVAGKLTPGILGRRLRLLDARLQRHGRCQERRCDLLVVLVADEDEVDHARID